MKPHDPTSTPASSGRHLEDVRVEDALVCIPMWAARIAYVEIFAVMDRMYWRLPPADSGYEATEEEAKRYGNLQRLHEQLTVAVGFHPAVSCEQVR
jgi:hypothetical protein